MTPTRIDPYTVLFLLRHLPPSGGPVLDPNPANLTGNGLIVTVPMGENVTAGQLLLIKSDGKYYKARANAAATMPAQVLALENTTAGNQGKVLHLGYFRNDAWSFTPGNLIFVSATTAGAITQTRPGSSGNRVQRVGYVTSAHVIYFSPDSTVVELT